MLLLNDRVGKRNLTASILPRSIRVQALPLACGRLLDRWRPLGLERGTLAPEVEA